MGMEGLVLVFMVLPLPLSSFHQLEYYIIPFPPLLELDGGVNLLTPPKYEAETQLAACQPPTLKGPIRVPPLCLDSGCSIFQHIVRLCPAKFLKSKVR